MFDPPDSTPAEGLAAQTFQMSLPQVRCAACNEIIARRKHRMALRASWRRATEYLCPDCWHAVCSWAARFALEQLQLPL